jgi:hypothetical protein
MNGLSFVAQSLDNVGENPMIIAPAVASAELSEGERRQALMRRINLVRRDGALLALSSSRLECYRLAGEFTLEVTLLDRDMAGRVSPVLVHGWVPRGDVATWSQTLVGSLRDFVWEQERPFDPDLPELLALATGTIVAMQAHGDTTRRGELLQLVWSAVTKLLGTSGQPPVAKHESDDGEGRHGLSERP